jgi:hypothetical protein
MPDAKLTPRQRAARANGRKSRGPVTAAGKARAAMNAVRHGLRAEHAVVLASEDPAAYAAMGAALEQDLAPRGAMEQALVERIAAALWRLRRAERLEALFFDAALAGEDPLAPLDGPRLRTLLRYQAALRSELFRAHAALRAAQRERHVAERAAARAAARAERAQAPARDAFGRPLPRGATEEEPNEPDPAGESLAAARLLRRDPALAAHGTPEIAALLQRILARRGAAAGGAAGALPTAAAAATSWPCSHPTSSTSRSTPPAPSVPTPPT